MSSFLENKQVNAHVLYKCNNGDDSCTTDGSSEIQTSTACEPRTNSFFSLVGDSSYGDHQQSIYQGSWMCAPEDSPNDYSAQDQLKKSLESFLCGFEYTSSSTVNGAIDSLKAIFCHKYDWTKQNIQTIFECYDGNVGLSVEEISLDYGSASASSIFKQGSSEANFQDGLILVEDITVAGTENIKVEVYSFDNQWVECGSTQSSYYRCAGEGGSCSCPSGSFIKYGTDTTSTYHSKAADSSGSTSCSNGYFGDPKQFHGKTCWCYASTTYDACKSTYADKMRLSSTDGGQIEFYGIIVNGYKYTDQCQTVNTNGQIIQVKCLEDTWVDSIQVSFDQDQLYPSTDSGMQGFYFKCSSPYNQEATRTQNQIGNIISSNLQSIYSSVGSYFCGLRASYGAQMIDFQGLLSLDIMLCNWYDCQGSLNHINDIEDRVYKVTPGNTDFEKPQGSSVVYNQTKDQLFSPSVHNLFSNYIINNNTQYCALNECKLMENCASSPTELDTASFRQIWLDNSEINAMKTSDSAWDSTHIYHVNTDPEDLFTTQNLCIQCTNIDLLGKIDQTFTTNEFKIEIECPDDILVSVPDSFVQDQIQDASIDSTIWPRYNFSSFYTNSKACPVDYYRVSNVWYDETAGASNVVAIDYYDSPTGMVEIDPYDEITSTGTINDNTYEINVINGEKPYVYTFKIKAYVLQGNTTFLTNFLTLTADCPTTVDIPINDVLTFSDQQFPWIGATGYHAIYIFPQYFPQLPLCSILSTYAIHETTSTGKLTYPSTQCTSLLCNMVDIDVTEEATILFYIEKISSRDAGSTTYIPPWTTGQTSATDLITITITSTEMTPVLSVPVAPASSLTVIYGSIESYTFDPFDCSTGCQISYVISSSSSSAQQVTWLESSDLVFDDNIFSDSSPNGLYKFTLDQTESELISLGATSATNVGDVLLTLSMYVYAELKLYPQYSTFSSEVTISIVCGSQSISLDTSNEVTLPAYAKCISCNPDQYDFSSNIASIKFSTQSSLCPIIGYRAYDSSSLSTLWSDISIILLNQDTTSGTALQVVKTSAFSKSIYLKAITAGESYQAATQFTKFNVVVCGNEILSVQSLSSSQIQLIRQPGEQLQILKSSYEMYFTVSSSEHEDCEQFNTPILTQGSDCVTGINSSIFYIDPSDNFNVDTSNPISEVTICLTLQTIGLVEQTIQYKIEVCGNEIISKSKDSVIQVIYGRDGNNLTQQVNMQSNDIEFISSSTNCPVTSFSLVHQASYEEYLGTDIYLAQTYNEVVFIDTSLPIDGSFFVKAASQSGLISAYQQIDIKVCGFETVINTTDVHEEIYSKQDNQKTIYFNDYSLNFVNNDSISCPISEYKLLQDDGLTDYDRSSSLIYIDEETLDIIIKPRESEDLTTDETLVVYLQATSIGMVSAMYKFQIHMLKVDQSIVNQGPYFSDSESTYYQVRMNFKGIKKMTLRSPLIIDLEGDQIVETDFSKVKFYYARDSMNDFIEKPDQSDWITFEFHQSLNQIDIHLKARYGSDSGLWKILLELEDEYGNTNEQQILIQALIQEYDTLSGLTWEQIQFVDWPMYFTLSQPYFNKITKVEFFLTETGPSPNEASFFFNSMHYVIELNEPRSEEAYQSDLALNKTEVKYMIGYASGFKMYQKFVEWSALNPGLSLDPSSIEVVLRNYVVFEVTGLRWNQQLEIYEETTRQEDPIGNIDDSYNLDDSDFSKIFKEFQATFQSNMVVAQVEEEEKKEQIVRLPILKKFKIRYEQGKVIAKIEFDQGVFTNGIDFTEVISKIDSSILQVYAISGLDGSMVEGQVIQDSRYLSQETQEYDLSEAQRTLKFTWQTQEVKNDTIELLVNFEDTTYISSSPYGPDLMAVGIKQNDLILIDPDQYGQKIYSKNNLRPTQPSLEISEQMEQTVSVIAYVLMAIQANMLVLNILLSKSLQDLWGMLATQQITIHLMLFRCQQTNPGNVYVYNMYLSQLNQKDMYPTDEIFEEVFNFTETDSPIVHFESLGYEGANFIEMTGSVIINILLAVITAIMVRLANYIALKLKKFKFIRVLGSKLKLENTIGAILMIYLQGFLELLICVITCLTQISSNQFSGENSSDTIAAVFVLISTLVLFFLPSGIFFVILKNFNRLDEPETQEAYGFMYEGISTQKKLQTIYHVIYIFRRFLFVLIMIFLESYSGSQLVLHVMVQLFYTMYFAKVRPFEEKIHNDWEIFNEICVMLVSYILMWLTDEEMLPEDRNSIGRLYIGVCSFNLIVNGLKVMKQLTYVTFPQLYGEYKLFDYRRQFESKFKAWVKKKVQFAQSNANLQSSKLILEITNLTKQLRDDEKQYKKMKAQYHKQRIWLIKNDQPLFVISEEKTAIKALKKKIAKDRKKNKRLNIILKDLHFDTFGFGNNFNVRTIDDNMVAYEEHLLQMTHNKALKEQKEREKARIEQDIRQEKREQALLKLKKKKKAKKAKKVTFAAQENTQRNGVKGGEMLICDTPMDFDDQPSFFQKIAKKK